MLRFRILQLLSITLLALLVYLQFGYSPKPTINHASKMVDAPPVEAPRTEAAATASPSPPKLPSANVSELATTSLSLEELEKTINQPDLDSDALISYIELLTAAKRALPPDELKKRGSLIKKLERHLFARLGQVAPRRALPHLFVAGSEKMDTTRSHALIGSWSKEAPADALEWLSNIPHETSPFSHFSEYRNWAKGASQSEPQAVLQLAGESKNLSLRSQILSGFENAINIQGNHRDGIELLLSLASGHPPVYETTRLSQQWLKADSAAALAFVETLSQDSALFMPAAQPLIQQMASANFDQAQDWIEKLSQRNRAAALEIAVGAWTAADSTTFDAFTNWVEENPLPSPESLRQSLTNFLRANKIAIEKTEAWLQQNVSNQTYKDQGLTALIQLSSREGNILQPLELAREIENAELRDAQRAEIEKNIKQMKTIFSQHGSSPPFDEFLAPLAQIEALEDPRKGLATATTIDDQQKRQEVEDAILSYWKNNDEHIYLELLETTNQP